MTTNTHPQAGNRVKAPTFTLPTLEALAAWRHALASREEWRTKFSTAQTPQEKGLAVSMIDRYSRDALTAERALRGSLIAEVTP